MSQIAQIQLTAWITRLLGLCSAALATAGITLNYGPDSASKIASILLGLAGVLIHLLVAHFNLNRAIQLPSQPPKSVTQKTP